MPYVDGKDCNTRVHTKRAASQELRPFGSSPVNSPVDSIAFDSPLPAAVLNTEAKSRSNLFPWRGQFTPQLVEALLYAYAPPGAVVLDPFMGSGTVLVESARLGLPAYGYEVNPAAYILARVYEVSELSMRTRREVLNTAEALLAQARPSAFEMPLFCATDTSSRVPSSFSDCLRSTTNPYVRALVEALVVLLDGRVNQDAGILHYWAFIREVVMNLPRSRSPIRACFGDARGMNLPDGAVEFVLSSPPYINVFNYHHNSRTGIELLGYKPLVVAKSEIGANRKFRHNRFLTVVQYCIDMALVLRELRRVCADSARIILVLGRESNVHKTPFYNGQILEHLAVRILNFRLHLKQERVFLNRFGQSIYEDLLHLSFQSTACLLSEDAIVELARNVGKQVLIDARERTPAERKHFLDEAIAHALSHRRFSNRH